LESDGEDHTETTIISGAIDETELEGVYPHEFRATSNPTQEILFSKDGGVDQACYYWGSEALTNNSDNASAVDIDSSYYTTGNGMMLHSILDIDNCTSQIDYDSSAGIIESGFVGSVRDWIREYSETVLLVCVVVASLVAIGLVARRRRKRSCTDETAQVEEPD
jgi:hypothetical protein